MHFNFAVVNCVFPSSGRHNSPDIDRGSSDRQVLTVYDDTRDSFYSCDCDSAKRSLPVAINPHDGAMGKKSVFKCFAALISNAATKLRERAEYR